MESQFARGFKARMEKFSAGLSVDPHGVVAIEPSVAEQVFRFLLDSACLSQSSEALTMGTEYLLGLPRGWALGRLREIIEERRVEFLQDDYAYRRLIDLMERFQGPWPLSAEPTASVFDYVLKLGVASSDPEVHEVALAYLAHRTTRSLPSAKVATRSQGMRAFRRDAPRQAVLPEREIGW